MIMKRKILERLIDWKNDILNRKPIVLWGARQVGKTYLLKNLLAPLFKDSIYIDLLADNEDNDFFRKHIKAEDCLEYLKIRFQKDIDKDTLIVFDEAQSCLPVLTALKYFNQDYPEIPVIVTGSMVRMALLDDKEKEKYSLNNLIYPVGKVIEMNLHPLTFDEYLMNANDLLYKKTKDSYMNLSKLKDFEHEQVLKEFYQFLAIGGMPEAVDNYLKNKDLYAVKSILSNIYNSYLRDMNYYSLYKPTILRTQNVFQNIYTQLNKNNQNFKISALERGKRVSDYQFPLDWLLSTGLVYRSKALKERVTLPLTEGNPSLFRIYLSDMGIFTYESRTNISDFLFMDKRSTISGIFYENFVADEFVSHGVDLFFWQGKDYAEFEFVVSNYANVMPIDVKKTKGKLNSLKNFVDHNSIEMAVKITPNPLGLSKVKVGEKEYKVLNVPFYFVPFFAEEISMADSDILKRFSSLPLINSNG